MFVHLTLLNFQRLGAVSEDSNTVTTPITKEPVEEPEEEPEEPIEQPKTKPETVEESHTPPLPPELKIKLTTDTKKTDVKTKGKDNKNNNWDMFAEQDTFKNDCNVSISLLFSYMTVD